MDDKVINIQLTPAERALILRYGYPSEEFKQALQACKSSEIEVIPVEAFELDELIGQLCISIKERRLGRVWDQLHALCDRLEHAELTGDGMIDDS